MKIYKLVDQDNDEIDLNAEYLVLGEDDYTDAEEYVTSGKYILSLSASIELDNAVKELTFGKLDNCLATVKQLITARIGWQKLANTLDLNRVVTLDLFDIRCERVSMTANRLAFILKLIKETL